MNSSSHFKCECQHCHGHLEYPTDAAGQVIECPHCGNSTELPGLTVLPESSGNAEKIILASVVLIALIVASAIWAARDAKETALGRQEAEMAARLAAQQAAEAEAKAKNPLAQAGWKISSIRLEKSPGSAIIHANGELINETARRRFGVKMKFDLFDEADQKIGSASDYQSSIEPEGRWQFSALVVDARSVTAKVAAIEESP